MKSIVACSLRQWRTGEKPENARGVDHIGVGCGGPSELAGEYERLNNWGLCGR
jgi:hypothetical protein